MSPEDFELLLNLVRPLTEKKYTPVRDEIPAHERLTVTLLFLTTGNSYSTLMCVHRTSKSSVCNMRGHSQVLAHALYILSSKTCLNIETKHPT
jgi:hypothetical protein